MRREIPSGYVRIAGEPGDDGFACQSKSSLMRIVVSWGMGWEHVSVSHQNRLPTYEEMEWVAGWFWPEEAAVQYHVPKSDHINNHKYCLHWWRPTGTKLPRPPSFMVGIPGLELPI